MSHSYELCKKTFTKRITTNWNKILQQAERTA